MHRMCIHASRNRRSSRETRTERSAGRIVEEHVLGAWRMKKQIGTTCGGERTGVVSKEAL